MGRYLDARLMGMTSRTMPPASATTPPASRPAAIQGNAGSVAPTSTWTLTGRDPSAFIATTVQLPLRTGHTTVCAPGPEAYTTQVTALAGGAAGAVPPCAAYQPLLPAGPLTVACATLDRYRDAAPDGAIPMKTGTPAVD